MFNRVLVPLDGSMLAELALNPALQLTRQARGAIVLVQVPVHVDHWAIEGSDYDSGWVPTMTAVGDQEADSYLRELQETLLQAGVQTRTMVVEGELAAAIINSSCACSADLVVMATHARTGVSRWLFGSVASKVLRQSNCPVLLVRRTTRFDHMLVIVDGSPVTETVIAPALSVAKALGSRVTFLGLNRARRADRANSPGSGANKARLQAYLARLQAAHQDSNVNVETAVTRDANKERILSFAVENRVDLIAVSDMRRHGLSKLFEGSIAEQLLRKSGCAMLITRPPAERRM